MLTVILDRDGCLVQNNLSTVDGPYYILDTNNLIFCPNAREALINLYAKTNALIFITTSQNAVGEQMSVEDLRKINWKMEKHLTYRGHSIIKAIRVSWGRGDPQSMRMALIASLIYDNAIDLAHLWYVDDSGEGIMAAQKLGCRTIWIETPFGELNVTSANYIVTSLKHAIQIILDDYSQSA